MKATAVEFRFRVVWLAMFISLGFTAPWIELLHWGTRTTTWLWLGFELSGLGISPTVGFELVTILAILLAGIAAVARVWGTAYLGAQTVNSMQMKAGGVMAEGPYRYVRNPLYIGTWSLFAAISILMPPSGALVAMVLTTLFLLRLILGEEAFLAIQLGQPFAAYREAVPRLIPSLRPRVPASGLRPHWGRALLGEILPLGVLVGFAALSWQYNAELLERAVLISFGISLVVRAMLLSNTRSIQPSA